MLELVNPHIGTGARGNCLIGPTLPFGMVRLGPDIAYPQPNSGYRPGKSIVGFSHTRLAGTGGAGRYGNIRVMPLAGEPRRLQGPPFLTFPATDRMWSRPVGEHAAVGEYGCRFSFGVEVELTCTAHVGVHRYRFAEGTHPHLIVDLSALLQGGVAPPGQVPYCEDWEMEARCTGANAEISNGHVVLGSAGFLGGWGHFQTNRIHFFLRSREGFLRHQLANESGLVDGSAAGGSELRVILEYPAGCREVNLEVGISFSSTANARRVVETESRGEAFEAIRDRAKAAWEPWFGRVEVEGGTSDQQTMLKTSLLRLFTQPTDLRGDGGNGFTDIVCLWDSIRNANSLQHLIAPEFSADLMNSLLQAASETGWIPDAHIAGHPAYQQSGCCAEILFSEAARKEIPGVDYRKALAACVRNAETFSDAPAYRGRYLADYENLGFLSTRVPKGCVSRHIEYAYQDWCIARLAEHLGESGLASRFEAKAQRLWNLWNEDQHCFLPRHPDGSWVPGVDPKKQAWDGWNDPYSYESTLELWKFSALSDIPGLIGRFGGAKPFVASLDELLGRNIRIEKETRMIIPHLYAFAGRPDRTADVIRNSLEQCYKNSADGLPDDEDMGCHSAYYICNSTGLYPIYGQTCYSVVPPLFERSTLHYGTTGRALTILRTGTGKHIRSIKLNGRSVSGTLLDHSEIAVGGTLEIGL